MARKAEARRKFEYIKTHFKVITKRNDHGENFPFELFFLKPTNINRALGFLFCGYQDLLLICRLISSLFDIPHSIRSKSVPGVKEA